MPKIFLQKKLLKLYDLMLMVFKYQVVNCHKPEDILLVTLNHLDAIKDSAQPYSDLSHKVKNLYLLLISNYGNLCYDDYECLCRCIDAFLEDLNIRVSVLMKLGLQLPSGEIVIAKNDTTESRSDATEKEWQLDISSNSFDFDGERHFTLGTNIYNLSAAREQAKTSPESQPSFSEHAVSHSDKELQGIEELSLLTRLIGKCIPSNSTPEIILASPNEDNFSLHDIETEESCSVVNIDASQISKQDLEKISNDLVINVEDKQKFDILELLDTVERNSI